MTTPGPDAARRHAVRPATACDVPALAMVLTEAFRDYPWTRWTIPEDGYDQRLETLQRAYLDHAIVNGGRVWTTDAAEAVAAFVPAAMPDPAPDVVERIMAAHGDRIARVGAHEAAAAAVRPEHDWVLATVGVVPQCRGRGLGSVVLRAGLDDLLGARILLETSEVANVRLYQRLGFQIAGEVAGDGPFVWVMLR